jgi:hypothetical protein
MSQVSGGVTLEILLCRGILLFHFLVQILQDLDVLFWRL